MGDMSHVENKENDLALSAPLMVEALSSAGDHHQEAQDLSRKGSSSSNNHQPPTRLTITKPNDDTEHTLASDLGKLQALHQADEISIEEGAGKLQLDDPLERGSWGGKLEFLFTCIGYAVGLGNVWRFPYLCYKNGGGAFLFPYLIMLACVGLPLFFMELALGQFGSLGPIAIWKINPLLKGLGWAMVSVSWLIGLYYNVVISHVMVYLFASFAAIPSGLPWMSCNNTWNTPDCLEPKTLSDLGGNLTHLELLRNSSELNHTVNVNASTPAEEYYYNYVLEMSDGIDNFGYVNWKLALCLLLAWIIVLICLIRGIQSLGKVVYFTAIFPYIMLTVLLIRGLTLDGAIDGIIFYLKPDFSRLTDARVWSDAATQIFYSLSACSGGLIAMASYNKFDNNCLRDSVIVALINCATSVYAGFVIFSILGFIAYEKGVSVAEVADGGPGLAFVVYPEALSKMPAPVFWAICFFFMMATLGFGSQFSIIECVLSAITDEFAQYLRGKWPSIIFRSSVILLSFLLGLPMVCKGGYYLLTLVDYSVGGFPLLIVGLLELVALNYFYNADYVGDRFLDDITLMLGKRPHRYWKICWKGISPVIISITIVFNCVFYEPPKLGDHYFYPPWAQALGWMVALFPILLIPGFFLVIFCRDGGFLVLRQLMYPNLDWGPALPENRQGIYRPENALTPSHYTSADGHFNFGNQRYVINAAGVATPVPLRRPCLFNPKGSRGSLQVGSSQTLFPPPLGGSHSQLSGELSDSYISLQEVPTSAKKKRSGSAVDVVHFSDKPADVIRDPSSRNNSGAGHKNEAPV